MLRFTWPRKSPPRLAFLRGRGVDAADDDGSGSVDGRFCGFD